MYQSTAPSGVTVYSCVEREPYALKDRNTILFLCMSYSLLWRTHIKKAVQTRFKHQS